jgi:hypothetical protein
MDTTIIVECLILLAMMLLWIRWAKRLWKWYNMVGIFRVQKYINRIGEEVFAVQGYYRDGWGDLDERRFNSREEAQTAANAETRKMKAECWSENGREVKLKPYQLIIWELFHD